jgi:LemA protein
MSEVLMFLMVAIVVIFVGYILMGNTLVGLKNAVEKATANIDVYLQQRLDLMENLFQELERGLEHEENVLNSVTAMRSRLTNIKNGHDSSSSTSIVKTDMEVGGLIREFNATREAYPVIEGMGLVKKVMDENSRVEREITSARRTYNTNVTAYRNAIKMFPSSFIASMKGFTDEYELYQADAQARQRVKPMWEDKYRDKYKADNKPVENEQNEIQ